MPKKVADDEAVENVQTSEETMQSLQDTAEPEVVKPKRGRKKAEPAVDTEPDMAPETSLDETLDDFADPLDAEPAKPSARQAFYGLNFHKLDRDLSPDEQREWNAIYASYRASSILTGRVAGVDDIQVGGQSVTCLVAFDYRVKVMIPYTEVWADDAVARPVHILHRFLGAEVDYIVREVDREGDCVVASRRMALQRRRRSLQKHMPETGDLVDCRVLAVSTTKMLVECGGYDVTLAQKNISYGSILDLREDYRPGQTVKAVFKGLEGDRIKLSIKEVNPHPFDGVETRHPLYCRRVSRIMGKYAGGVFCELEKGFTCLCVYSPEQRDENFDPGDNVIIVVTRYDYANKLVYGRIVTGW